MAIDARVTWEMPGGRDISYAVATITGDFPAEVRNAAHDILTRASQRAPVKTGRLRGSGQVLIAGTRAVVRFTAPYSGHVEFGAPRHRPPVRAQPYLRPAVDAVVEQFNGTRPRNRSRSA